VAKFGFKEITPSNWLERDDVLKGFVRISPEGQQVRPITSDDYLRDILKPELLESVPTDVQALFEVARGAMAYGYFFYPLYTLAAEQLFRVAETAIAHKSKTLGVPKSNDTFEKRIGWLVDREVIPSSERVQWDAIRTLRNIASHPEYQSIHTPGNAIGTLGNIARQINSLFGSA
jgi:hypothetical protein